MTDRSTDSFSPRELRASKSSEEPPSEGAAETNTTDPMSSAADALNESSGLFRQVLLAWFAGSEVEEPFRQVGRLLADMVARTPQPTPQEEVTARLRAIVADLVFLALFLQEAIDVRQHSTLDAEDWELARTAGHEGTRLHVLRETLLSEISLEPEATPTPQTLEDFISCRETALWPLATPTDRHSIRTITALLHGYAREVQVLESKNPESAIRRDARAAAVDLRHLSEFVVETSGLVEGELAEGLVGLSGELAGAAGRLAEARKEKGSQPATSDG